MADMAQQMIDRLQAGPVVKAGNTIVVPVLRFTSAFGEKFGAVGTVVPVAVVAIAGDDVRAWLMNGQAESLQRLLEDLPDLAQLIESVRV